MVVRSAGYRPKSGVSHYHTFLALEACDRHFVRHASYFDTCRVSRNACEYDSVGLITHDDAMELTDEATRFAVEAERMIKAKHPRLG